MPQEPKMHCAHCGTDKAKRKDKRIAAFKGKIVEQPTTAQRCTDIDQRQQCIADSNHMATPFDGHGRGVEGIETNCKDGAGHCHQEHQYNHDQHLLLRLYQQRQQCKKEIAQACQQCRPENRPANCPAL
ncbi:MAG: hypothetical protein R2932_27220 [Caldilineaceae bacterium]